MEKELSEEMKTDLINGIMSDCSRLGDVIGRSRAYNPHNMTHLEYKDLEMAAYITEEIRMKLRVLGAPRMSFQ